MASKSSVSEKRGSKTPNNPKQSKGAPKSTSKKSKDDSEDTIAIDLTNPDDLLQKLDQLDLDEEETDALLKRAYEVNRELKKQLELGRKVMDKQMSASAKGSAIGHHRRPGSNMTSKSRIPNHPPLNSQTRMASASQVGGGRKKTTSQSLANPMQSYSYHSYTDSQVASGKY